ncbi:MAG: hypothetical protein ACRCZ0_05935, partial [Cetobacterium sp.]
DGEHWTFNTAKAFQELFPYMKQSTITKKLKKLTEIGVFKTGNYNKLKFDRTAWYCIKNDEIKAHYKIKTINKASKTTIRQNDECNNQIGECIRQNDLTIPDINTDINTDIKKIDTEDESINHSSEKLDLEKVEFTKNFREYINIVSKATQQDKFRIEQVITPSMFRELNLKEILIKIQESSFLKGELKDKPRIGNFTDRKMINMILLDKYKDHEEKSNNGSKTIKRNDRDTKVDWEDKPVEEAFW